MCASFFRSLSDFLNGIETGVNSRGRLPDPFSPQPGTPLGTHLSFRTLTVTRTEPSEEKIKPERCEVV